MEEISKLYLIQVHEQKIKLQCINKLYTIHTVTQHGKHDSDYEQ